MGTVIKSKRLYHYTLDHSYERAYNEYFYRQFSSDIRGTVLDLGSKTNNEGYYLTVSRDVNKYIAVDIVPTDLLDIVSDGTNLAIKDDSIDTIILSEVIEHIPIHRLEALFGEIKRVLKPNGTLLAHIPFIYPYHGDADMSRPTYQGLEELMNHVGFEYEIIKGGTYSEVFLHVLDLPTRKLANKLGSKIPLYIFAVLHYIVVCVATVFDRVIKLGLGRNDVAEAWYISQFIRAKPRA